MYIDNNIQNVNIILLHSKTKGLFYFTHDFITNFYDFLNTYDLTTYYSTNTFLKFLFIVKKN